MYRQGASWPLAYGTYPAAWEWLPDHLPERRIALVALANRQFRGNANGSRHAELATPINFDSIARIGTFRQQPPGRGVNRGPIVASQINLMLHS
jgi:hypothetical protein